MRQCTKCGIAKPESEFYLHSVSKRGVVWLRNTCKECRREQHYDHTGDPKPEGRICTHCGVYKPLSQFHKHRACLYGVEPICKRCRLEKRREYARKYARKYPERIRMVDLKAKYGTTLADYNAMYERQGGRCAICGVVAGKLVVDHNHQTGKVRELLCNLCNAMIGCAREDLAIIAAAAAYPYREQHPDRASVGATITFS